MKPFKSIRLAYIEDLDSNPDVQASIKESHDKESGMFWLNSTNYGDFTTEVLAKLKKLFDEKKIGCYPKMGSNDTIYWLNGGDQILRGSLQRHEDLPNIMIFNDELRWTDKIGNLSRPTGPVITRKNGDQFWTKNGTDFILGKRRGKYFHRIKENTVQLSAEQYNEKIAQLFPEAKKEYYAAV